MTKEKKAMDKESSNFILTIFAGKKMQNCSILCKQTKNMIYRIEIIFFNE